MTNSKVRDLMTKNPILIAPDASLQMAAEKMESIDCGVLPVGTMEKLEGMITDRDIVIRAIAKGKDPNKEKVRQYMSNNVFSCQEDDSLEAAADMMRKHQVSRLIVKDKSGKITGILSFGCIIRKGKSSSEIAKVVEHLVGKKAA